MNKIEKAAEKFASVVFGTRVSSGTLLVFIGGLIMGDALGSSIFLGDSYLARFYFAILFATVWFAFTTYLIIKAEQVRKPAKTGPTAKKNVVSADGVDDVEAHFSKTFDLMGRLFGSNAVISCMTDVLGQTMHVACRHCKKKNRLQEGIGGARCGSCKKPLMRAAGDKEDPTTPSKIVN